MKIPFMMILTSLYLVASTAFISSTELEAKLHDKTLVILDVTDEQTYMSGHIPNAVRADAGAFSVRTHPIWPPRAFILSQLTHQHLARLRIDYLASQESVMRG